MTEIGQTVFFEGIVSVRTAIHNMERRAEDGCSLFRHRLHTGESSRSLSTKSAPLGRKKSSPGSDTARRNSALPLR